MKAIQLGFNPLLPSVAEESDGLDAGLARTLYGDQIHKCQQYRDECCFLLYGAARIGKTFLCSCLGGSTEVIDCTPMGTLISSTESVDSLLEYL